MGPAVSILLLVHHFSL